MATSSTPDTIPWNKATLTLRVPPAAVPDRVEDPTPDWLDQADLDVEEGLQAVARSLTEKYAAHGLVVVVTDDAP